MRTTAYGRTMQGVRVVLVHYYWKAWTTEHVTVYVIY